jgi:hypothetical protein
MTSDAEEYIPYTQEVEGGPGMSLIELRRRNSETIETPPSRRATAKTSAMFRYLENCAAGLAKEKRGAIT